MADAQQEFRSGSYTFTEDVVMKPFQEFSVLRTFADPILKRIPEKDYSGIYWKAQNQIKVRHNRGDPVGAPATTATTTKHSTPVPHFESSVSFNRWQVQRLPEEELDLNERLQMLLAEYPKWEDGLVFGGSSNLVGITTGGDGVTYQDFAANLDLTDVVVAKASLVAFFRLLKEDFGEGFVKANPCILVVTPDVDDRITGFDDSATVRSLEDTIMNTLKNQSPHPLTQKVVTPFLGCSDFSVDEDNTVSYTAGVTHAALWVLNPMYSRVFTTDIVQYGGFDEKSHLNMDFLLRSGLLVKDPNVIAVSASVDITSA